MKDVLKALKSQLVSNISYISEANTYINANYADLVSANKYPFLNCLVASREVRKADGINFDKIERHIITFEIGYAVSYMNLDKLYFGAGTDPGIDDLSSDIVSAIKKDYTLDGWTRGFPPDDHSIEIASEPGMYKPGSGYAVGYTITFRMIRDVVV